ncbi:capsular polysaccharide biosynthesis protein [Halobacillus halophilus]|uniref:capsular polysaccharide export protein, LipB/KpsS family n=1 Tax=Halobacillus halophilus TaxID=1570 RepID=UPI00136ACBD3|nr:capsular polysaccharide biosynthesis protein [Halobacillus halophilus]
MNNRLKESVKRLVKNVQVLLLFIEFMFKPIHSSEKTVALVFNVSKWKRNYVQPYLKDYEVKFIPLGNPMFLLKFMMKRVPYKVIVNWGYSHEAAIQKLAKDEKVPIYRIEDGFLRSAGLGSMHTPPYSMCLDTKGMYFDSTKESDLEDILNHYDFSSDPVLLERSENIIRQLLELKVSKYNHVQEKDISELYGSKRRRRVLVIGQVEDDASIKMGSRQAWTNNDLVRLAVKENPGDEVIYKPHPDVLMGRRERLSNPEEIMDIAKVIEEPLSIDDAFQTIDHLYTITSLTGFEAMLRGIKVTTVGAPFYSGWGLTDDRQEVSRRKRILSIEELFAGAYILYPAYINPHTKKKISIEEAIDSIVKS